MNFNFENINEKSKLLKSFFKVGVPQFLILGSLKSDYSKVDEKDIDNELYKILNKNTIIPYLEKIKNSDKNVVCITFDSNDGISHHAKNVKGLIDSNLYHNDLLDKVDSIFIPTTTSVLLDDIFNQRHIVYNKNFSIEENISNEMKYNRVKALLNEELTFNEILFELGENESNKKIVINKSLADTYSLPQDAIYDLNFLDNEKILNRMFKNIKCNRDLINNLNKSPNINICISGGNSEQYYHKKNDDWDMHKELNECFFEITKGDFQKIKELVIYLNNIIENKFIKSIHNTQLLDKLKEENPTLNIDKFFSTYMKDFLLHHQNYDLLKNSNKLLNNNINIIEAYDYNTFEENYKLYTKYNSNIKELDDFFQKLSFVQKNTIVGLDKKNIDILKEDYNKYKDKYPSVFKISKYGCFCNLEFDDSNIIKLEAHGHNKELKGKLNGTSFASPEYISDLIKNHIKDEKTLNLSQNFI